MPEQQRAMFAIRIPYHGRKNLWINCFVGSILILASIQSGH
jgi:hypothetical protein